MKADETTVWGINIKNIPCAEPIEGNFIAIGWHELGDVTKLPPNREAFKTAYSEAILNSKLGTIRVSAGQVFRFSHEMKVGDIVVFPSRQDRMVNIGQVTGDLEYRPNAGEYVNRRSVKWLKHLPRNDFSQSALNELGTAMTLFRISSYAGEFLSALTGTIIHQVDESDDEAASNIAIQLEESTEDFIVRRLKEHQSAYEFEHFVAHLLRCMGYRARVTRASNDGGIDIIAHRDELGFEPPIIKVQCKQSTGTFDRPEVQKLYGSIERDEKGLFVILGSYSTGARTFEQTKSNLRLLDGKELVELILENYERFSPEYRALLPLKRAFSPAI